MGFMDKFKFLRRRPARDEEGDVAVESRPFDDEEQPTESAPLAAHDDQREAPKSLAEVAERARRAQSEAESESKAEKAKKVAQSDDFSKVRGPVPLKAFSRFSEALPYTAYDDKHQLFYVEADEPGTVEGIGFCLEMRPQLGASEEMADYLTSLFLTSAPPGTGITIQIFGTPDLKEFFQIYEDITVKPEDYRDPTKRNQVALLNAIANKRIEYMKKGSTKGIFRDMNFRMRDFRANCSAVVPVPKIRGKFQKVDEFMASDDFESFMATVELMRETYISTLKSYHLYMKTWGPDDLINWCSTILNMQKTLNGEMPTLTYDGGKELRQYMVAGDTGLKESEFSIELNDGRAEPIHIRGMSVRSYPKAFCLNQMSELLGSPHNPTLSYPCPFLITTGVQILDYDTEKNRTIMKSARATQSSTSQMARFQPDMQDRKWDWDIALDAFNEGKGTIKLFHQILLFAKEDEIAKAEQAARAIWRSVGFDITVDRKMQKQALLSSLPMMFGPLMQRDLKTTQRVSTKTVFNAANMMPTLGEHTGVGLPVVSLFGRRGQAMSIDVFSNPSGNYNGIVVGASGSGKSFFLNELTQRVLATGGRVRIIDVGRSYEKLCKMLDGQFLEFTPDSRVCLNPFSMVTDLDEDMQLLKPMIGQMISPSEPLDDYQLAQVEINIRQLWAEHQQDMTLTMLSERLKKACYQGGSKEAFGEEGEEVDPEQCDPRIRDLGVQLFPFTTAGAYGRFFDGRANVDFHSDFVVLELEELKSMKDLQAVVMLLIMYKIMQEMYVGDRKQRTVVIIDEAWDLMGGGQSGKFIEAGYRRARKYNGAFFTGTQSVGDYYATPTAQAAFDNADWMFLLRQKSESLDQLAKSGRLSMDENTSKMLKSITTRHGVYSEVFVRCGDMAPTIGRLFVDPFSQLVGSSRAEDFEAVRAYVAQGKTTAQAIEQVLADRGITA